MIKFFRKIRQNLLSENKTSKYLLYAIGEIVLVVIGILIALQINNRNLEKNDRKNEIGYLNGIKSDLNQDINELKKHFSKDTLMLDAYRSLIEIYSAEDFKSKKDEIFSYTGSVLTSIWFEGSDVIFEDMKSSGKVNLIRSDSLRTAIRNYYKFSQEVIKEEVLFNDLILKFIHKYSDNFNKASLYELASEKRWSADIGKMNPEITYSPEFEQIRPKYIESLSGRKLMQYRAHRIRYRLYQRAIALDSMIDEYLNNQ